MPSIASRTINHPQIPVKGQPAPISQRPSLPPAAPIISSTLRCPMPALFNQSNPDNLRQYYAGGQIPQYRITPPSLLK